jgi:arginyl-tRNA synthetase
MPNCFTLTFKGQTEPATLNKVDEFLCEKLGMEVHPKYYVNDWYNTIGFLIATGHPLGSEKLRTKLATWFTKEDLPEAIKTLDIIEEYFTDNAFVEIGRN